MSILTHNGSKWEKKQLLSVQSEAEHLHHPFRDQGMVGRSCGKNIKPGGWGWCGEMLSSEHMDAALRTHSSWSLPAETCTKLFCQ